MDAHAAQRAGGPAQEAVALAVAADLVADVDAGRVRAGMDLHRQRVVDRHVHRQRGVEQGRVGAGPASASRMAAISTSAGVLVVSCISTRPGWKAISASLAPSRNQSNSAATVAARSAPRWWRTTFSSSSRSTTGRRIVRAERGQVDDAVLRAHAQRGGREIGESIHVGIIAF